MTEIIHKDTHTISPWKKLIDETPGNTAEVLRILGEIPGIGYWKISNVYYGRQADLKSSDAIKVLIKVNELRNGRAPLVIPQDFFLSVSVHNSAHN